MNEEADLLRDTERFMRRTARTLEGVLVSARDLWRRLAESPRYKRVDGRDDAHNEPVWDLAGTLDVMLCSDLERAIDYLDRDARKAGRAARKGRG